MSELEQFAVVLQRAKTFAEVHNLSDSQAYEDLSDLIFDMDYREHIDIPALRDAADEADKQNQLWICRDQSLTRGTNPRCYITDYDPGLCVDGGFDLKRINHYIDASLIPEGTKATLTIGAVR